MSTISEKVCVSEAENEVLEIIQEPKNYFCIDLTNDDEIDNKTDNERNKRMNINQKIKTLIQIKKDTNNNKAKKKRALNKMNIECIEIKTSLFY